MRLLAPMMAVLLAPPKLGSPGKPSARGSSSFGRLLQGKEREQGRARGAAAGLRPGLHDADEEELTGRPKRRPLQEAALDATARQAAQLAPPFMSAPATETFSGVEGLQAQVRTSLEDLLPQMVRKVAWSGDGRRGTVRLELGGGELAGATLLVHSNEGRIAVHLSAPAGSDVTGWRDRIAARLASRGMAVEDVEVE